MGKIQDTIACFEFRKEEAINNDIAYFVNDGKYYIFVSHKNNKEVITDSLCVFCYNRTGSNPYDNCANGVSVSPICQECLKHYNTIHDHLFKSGKIEPVSKRRMREDNLINEIDWEEIEKHISNKQAQIGLLAKKYKVTPKVMKKILLGKYGEKIAVKKGRKGGVFWLPDITIHKPRVLVSNSRKVKMTDTNQGSTDSKKTVDFEYVDQQISNGTAKLSELSKYFGIYPSEMKATLVAHYGENNIEFKRGRNGGIRLVNTS